MTTSSIYDHTISEFLLHLFSIEFDTAKFVMVFYFSFNFPATSYQ